MKTVLAIVVGSLLMSPDSWGQSDCNSNALADEVEIASGRAFDLDANGAIDSCSRPIAMPRLKAVTIYGAWGGHWDTIGPPGAGCWDIWIRRTGGAWMNDSATPTGNSIAAEIELGSGVNSLTMHRNVSDPTSGMLLVFADPAGSTLSFSALIYLNGGQVALDLNVWRVTIRNFIAISDAEDLVGEWAAGPDGRADSATSTEIFVELRPGFDCDQNGHPDVNDIAGSPALDCNNNGRIDACETGYADCNTNSIPDYCDIASGTSADADGNGVPDTCQPDCNLNDLPDAFEIASGLVSDLNADGTPDDCQGARMVRLRSPNLGAPSGDAARVWNVAELLPSETAVTIAVDLRGDLNGQTEWADIVLNDDLPRRFFAAGGNDCPAVPDRAVITLTREEYNDLIGADGLLSVRVVCPPSVDASECKGDGLVEITLSYVGIAPAGDCNGNSRLDVAETHDGTTPDCNANKRPDSCDIAGGTSQDCNGNGGPDSCALAATPAIDCNANGIIDTCDLAAGGTTVDCDQNGRIDSCQVAETPGTDCNGNLRPDACDVASGTSADRDGNLQPDECQTVSVPGDFATIQQAIDSAPAKVMRIVAVAPGTYAGPIAFNGKPVVVRGTAGAASTVIEGSSGQQLSVVRFTGGEPAIAALERVTVRGGATGSPFPNAPQFLVGGGILSFNSAASIRDCVIEQNVASFGAGAYVWNSTGSIERCTFRGNNAGSDGGGAQLYRGSPRMVDCVVENNVCNSRGGGLHIVEGTQVLVRTVVRNNQSGNLVGGVSWVPVTPATTSLRMEDCDVTGNTAAVAQGGVGVLDNTNSTTCTLLSTEVCGNLPRPNFVGRYVDLGGNVVCDCPADLSTDGVVNGADLGLLLAAWGPCSGACAADLNADGVVNGADLGALLAAWGICG